MSLQTLDQIKINPQLGMDAIRNNAGGAYLAYMVARQIDQLEEDGAGRVEIDLLYSVLDDLGVHVRTRQRWIKQLKDLGVFKLNNYGDYYEYAGISRASEMFGITRKLARPVRITDPRKLFKIGWHGEIWKARKKSMNGEKTDIPPRARDTLEDITGVPPRTQLHYEKQTNGHRKIRNDVNVGTVKHGSLQDRLAAVERFRNAMDDRGYQLDGVDILQRLPNVYAVTDTAFECASNGRTSKANKALRSHLSSLGRVDDERFDKLYFKSKKSATKVVVSRDTDQAYFHIQHIDGRRGGRNVWGRVSA